MRAQIGPLCPPLPPIRATCTTFLDVKNNVLSRITEPSNDDYDSDGSDNYDYNFLTFDDFGVKSDQKVSDNIILMPKCKGQHGGIDIYIDIYITFTNGRSVQSFY